MLEDSYFEPKGADFLLWGLVSPLACGGFSVSRQGFQTTKPRQSTRIHLLQSGSGAEREDSKLAWGQQVAPLAPRRQLRTPPCLPAKRTSAGWWWQSHLSRTGVVWIAEVMNALRKHKRMMRDIHPCTFLCLRPPAHHTPHVHTHTHTLRPPWRLAASLCLCPHHLQAHPTHHTHPHTHPHTPPPPHGVHTRIPPPHTAHKHPAPHTTHTHTHTHTLRCPLPGCVSRPLSLPPHPQADATRTHPCRPHGPPWQLYTTHSHHTPTPSPHTHTPTPTPTRRAHTHPPPHTHSP